MAYKSRSNWNIPSCLKKCKNKGKKCEDCIRFSNYEKDENEKQSKKDINKS